MILEIITPDQHVFKGEVSILTVPGKSGEFQVMKDHAAMVSTLAKGKLTLENEGEKQSFVIDGGVIEISDNEVLVLAEAVSVKE